LNTVCWLFSVTRTDCFGVKCHYPVPALGNTKNRVVLVEVHRLFTDPYRVAMQLSSTELPQQQIHSFESVSGSSRPN